MEQKGKALIKSLPKFAKMLLMSMEFIVALFLFGFFMITIAKEFKFFEVFFDRYPIATNYIPVWSFFAPKPYQTDYYILYRTVSKKNQISHWKQAYHIEKNRQFYAVIWNPNKIFLKGVIDIAMDLLNFSSKEKDKKRICLSIPYLHLLKFTESLIVNKNDVKKIQFMIMTNVQTENPELVFLSETHPLT